MPTIDPANLAGYATELLVALGTPREHATRVADSLVASDLRGHASHGTMRIPWYERMRDAGELSVTASPTVEREGPVVRVDGRGGFGQLAGRPAVDALVEAAVDHGVATAGVVDAAHLGRMGEWAERAAAAGVMVTIYSNTQGGTATVAPPGSATRTLSTNPIAVGVPTFDAAAFDVVLDMATSQVANGKIRARGAAGGDVPPEWTVTADGGSVSDPEAFDDGLGAALPLGGRTSGYKGFGLSVVSELFAGTVSDGLVGGQRESDWPSNAAAFLAVDPTAFTSVEAHEARVEALRGRIRAAAFSPDVPMGPGAKPEFGCLPGEPEYRLAMDRLAEGVPMPDRTAAELDELADRHDVVDAVPAALR